MKEQEDKMDDNSEEVIVVIVTGFNQSRSDNETENLCWGLLEYQQKNIFYVIFIFWIVGTVSCTSATKEKCW